MGHPPATRRRFRFSLRALLVLVTLAAVGSWGYWVGWPAWTLYREQRWFERTVSQLKAGSNMDDAFRLLKWQWHRGEYGDNDANKDNNIIQVLRYELPNSDYYIRFVLPVKAMKNGSINYCPCSNVEVFRAPHVPAEYHAFTQAGLEMERWNSGLSDHSTVAGTSSRTAPYTPGEIYGRELRSFIYGDRKNNPGFQYELIYSDPPK
ncbi:MAG TPA: hypothetical protein VKH44_04645 [Pirellulaceae bacterium]|nr:hypothetical protein [Pirellulaceae bacterium]